MASTPGAAVRRASSWCLRLSGSSSWIALTQPWLHFLAPGLFPIIKPWFHATHGSSVFLVKPCLLGSSKHGPYISSSFFREPSGVPGASGKAAWSALQESPPVLCDIYLKRPSMHKALPMRSGRVLFPALKNVKLKIFKWFFLFCWNLNLSW